MPSKPIITPVLKYWGFERHPFDDLVLRDGDLDLFIDRATEVRRLHNALSHSLCGVFGAQGVGKSSVLNKLGETVRGEGHTVVTVQMTGTSENLLYRELLAALLREVEAGRIKLSNKFGLKPNRELERVQNSIKYISSVEAAGEMGWKALLTLAARTGIKKQEEHELTQHTEETAVELIRQIACHAKEPFVAIIDNLERAKYMLNNKDAYFRFITKFAQTIDTTFSEVGVSFVVSLDQSFPDRIDGFLPGSEEAYSFSFGQLVEIKPFPSSTFHQILSRRLAHRKWPRKAADFIEPDAFRALMIATGGHPRRAFAVLREAMELIAAKSGKKQISLASMRTAISECGEDFPETDERIFQFLAQHGPHSSSDDKFMKAVGIGRAQLRTRLTELYTKGLLCSEQSGTGGTKKIIYFLENLDPA